MSCSNHSSAFYKVWWKLHTNFSGNRAHRQRNWQWR